MIKWAAPTRFEVPLFFQLKSEHFGMGERKARSFANVLNESHHAHTQIVVFGAAGGLDENLRAGEAFEIEEIVTKENRFSLKTKTNLKSTRLFTSQRVLANSREKQDAFNKHGASLVDMEMGFLWDQASDQVREKLVFIRCVFDPKNAELKLSARLALEMISNYRCYISGINKALTCFADTYHRPHKVHG